MNNIMIPFKNLGYGPRTHAIFENLHSYLADHCGKKNYELKMETNDTIENMGMTVGRSGHIIVTVNEEDVYNKIMSDGLPIEISSMLVK